MNDTEWLIDFLTRMIARLEAEGELSVAEQTRTLLIVAQMRGRVLH